MKKLVRKFYWDDYFFQIILVFAFVSTSPIFYALLFLILFLKVKKQLNIGFLLSKNKYFLMACLLFCLLFGLLSNIFIYNTVVIHFLIGLITLIFVYFYVNNMEKFYWASKVALITFQILTVIAIIKIGFNNFPVEVPLEKIIDGASANGITSYFIILQVNYFIAKKFFEDKVPIYTTIVTLVIALAGYGRGSILSAFLILLLSLFFKYQSNSMTKKIVFLFFFTCFLIFGVISYWELIELFILSKTKLSQGLEDGHRSWILIEYIKSIELRTLIFGAEYPDFVYYIYNGNPHNSFIRAHHFFGFPYLVFVLALPIIVILFVKINNHKLVLGACFFIVLFRSFSEPIILPTLLDFYYYSAFFGIPNLKYFSSKLMN